MSNKKDLQSEITRRKLVGIARTLFAQRGYEAIGTEEIVHEAKVTRGALYHHYRNKLELFAAVVDAVMKEMHDGLVAAAAGTDLWRSLELGVEAFLDQGSQEEFLRILFRDGPSVLGWARWREMDARYGMGLLQKLLEAAMAQKIIAVQPIKPLTHLLLGALTEASLMIGNSEDPTTTRRELRVTFRSLLDGLRMSPK